MSVLTFDRVNHIYRVAGREVVSVTRALERAGMTLHLELGPEYRERGIAVHALTERYDRAALVGKKWDMRTVPVRYRGFLQAWIKFLADTGWVSELIEHLVYSEELDVAGRLDRIGRFPGRRPGTTVLDVKTSTVLVVPEHTKFQLVGYGMAHDPRRIFERVAVCLGPSGKYKITSYPVNRYTVDANRFREILRQARMNKLIFSGR